MNRITKKEFIETLGSFSSVFCGSVFRWNDEKIVKALENFKPEQMEKTEKRTVTEKHGNYIVFSNGSRLDFNQGANGKNEYFSYRGQNGIFYIMQRLSYFDEFDNAEYLDYIVYAIPEKMEAPKTEEKPERKFHDAEHDKIITESDLRKIWDEMTAEEKNEYNGNFGWYLNACQQRNGGTLEEMREKS